jgi:hypothetical protein
MLSYFPKKFTHIFLKIFAIIYFGVMKKFKYYKTSVPSNLSIFKCVCMYGYVYTRVCVYIYNTCTNTYTCMYMCACVCTHMYINIYDSFLRMHTCIHAYMHTCILSDHNLLVFIPAVTDTAILIIFEGQFQVFQRFFSSNSGNWYSKPLEAVQWPSMTIIIGLAVSWNWTKFELKLYQNSGTVLVSYPLVTSGARVAQPFQAHVWH